MGKHRFNTGDAATTPSGLLAGIRVVELGGIGPAPFGAMLLADHGADVIRLDPPASRGLANPATLLRNRRSVAVDLKRPEGVAVALRLIGSADAVVEGFRPGVAERLGLGPDQCLAHNPRLVYARMTGWGQDGPLSEEVGHDIDYIAVAGALGAIGPAGGDPVVPLNLIADMGGGGMLLALGLTSALLNAARTGRGQVVDAAMVDGTALQLGPVLELISRGAWREERGTNLLDGGAPYYRTYRCADGGHLAVGAVEPEFYANLLDVLGLAEDPLFAAQHDRAAWPAMAERIAAVLAARTRDEWTARFAGRGACTAPVLTLTEATSHPHNAARGTYIDVAGRCQPAPAPRYRDAPAPPVRPAPGLGTHTAEVLAEVGYEPDEITRLHSGEIVLTTPPEC
ncbi:CaiB/BaiF CoA-transferase family protein [Saccharopolyspora sp. NPDC050642]|uniref:CaiB/BaiF CoA transferase family protein n=1 Tax=Saccharopolyspora sp. NPDC050642 TaxID=3157099 RepID=UPI0033C04BD6